MQPSNILIVYTIPRNKEQKSTLAIVKITLNKYKISFALANRDKLRKKQFKDKDLIIFDKYIGPCCSGSGDESECYFGKIKDKEIYFYIMDDPGLSGYDCCGSVTLYYSDSFEIVKENIDFLYKVDI